MSIDILKNFKICTVSKNKSDGLFFRERKKNVKIPHKVGILFSYNKIHQLTIHLLYHPIRCIVLLRHPQHF